MGVIDKKRYSTRPTKRFAFLEVASSRTISGWRALESLGNASKMSMEVDVDDDLLQAPSYAGPTVVCPDHCPKTNGETVIKNIPSLSASRPTTTR